MNDVLDKLTSYVEALSNALELDGFANDRPLLVNHLASAATMFALIHKHNAVSVIKDLVEAENRNHGWSYIAGPSGDNIASAWIEFKDTVKNTSE